VFSDALSDFSVPYVHLALAHTSEQSFVPIEFEVIVQIADFSIPPVVSMQNFQLALQHTSPSDTDPAQIHVHGSAIFRIAGIDAICSFTIDKSKEGIASFVNTSSEGFADEETDSGPGQTLGADGYTGNIDIRVQFPNDCPSVGEVISHFIGDLADAAGLGIIQQCVPDALNVFFDCVDFKEFQFTLSKSADTSGQWTLLQLSAELDLDGLQDEINLFAPVLDFGEPRLYFEINDPMSSVSYVICDAEFSAGLKQPHKVSVLHDPPELYYDDQRRPL
jgi:hypothetical protein